MLKDLGCIALVETVKKKGAKEHIYRATGAPIVTDEEWESLSPMVRRRVTLTVLQRISADLAVALGAGMFDTDLDTHVSRTPLNLDRQGWTEVSAVLERTLNEVLEIGQTSPRRPSFST